jgi:hypothetical protein
MKKFIVLLFIGFIAFGSSIAWTFASWSITGDGVIDSKTYWTWNYSWYIESCSNESGVIWIHIPSWELWMMWMTDESEAGLNTLCWENNPITVLTHETWQETTLETGNIMTGPIGYIVYFTLGLSLLGVVILTIKKFF